MISSLPLLARHRQPALSSRASLPGAVALKAIALLLVMTGSLGPLLAGCASKPVDGAAIHQLHRIAFITPAEPDHYTVSSNDSFGFELIPGYSGGANDGLVSVHGDNAINQRFRAQMAERQVMLGADLTREVTAQLTAAGYDVVPVTLPPAGSGRLHGDLSSLAGKADAALDITFLDAGYAYHTWHPYQPAARIQVQLTDLGTHQALLARIYTYGNTRPKKALQDKQVPPSTQFNFRNGTSIYADPDRAAAGLRTAPPALAKALVADLKQP